MRLTRKPPSPSGSFTIVPNALWSDERLNSDAVRIYAFLVGCKPDENYDPEWIRNRLHLSESKWKNAWRVLKAQKLIEVIRVGTRSYELHVNELWGAETEGSSSGVSKPTPPEVTRQNRPPLNKKSLNKTQTNKTDPVKPKRKRLKASQVPSRPVGLAPSALDVQTFIESKKRVSLSAVQSEFSGFDPSSVENLLRSLVKRHYIKFEHDKYKKVN